MKNCKNNNWGRSCQLIVRYYGTSVLTDLSTVSLSTLTDQTSDVLDDLTYLDQVPGSTHPHLIASLSYIRVVDWSRSDCLDLRVRNAKNVITISIFLSLSLQCSFYLEAVWAIILQPKTFYSASYDKTDNCWDIIIIRVKWKTLESCKSWHKWWQIYLHGRIKITITSVCQLKVRQWRIWRYPDSM